MKPCPLPYDESLNGCVPTDAALMRVRRSMTATVAWIAWKIAIWGTEFDEFTVYQTTNETRIRELAYHFLTVCSVGVWCWVNRHLQICLHIDRSVWIFLYTFTNLIRHTQIQNMQIPVHIHKYQYAFSDSFTQYMCMFSRYLHTQYIIFIYSLWVWHPQKLRPQFITSLRMFKAQICVFNVKHTNPWRNETDNFIFLQITPGHTAARACQYVSIKNLACLRGVWVIRVSVIVSARGCWYHFLLRVTFWAEL